MTLRTQRVQFYGLPEECWEFAGTAFRRFGLHAVLLFTSATPTRYVRLQAGEDWPCEVPLEDLPSVYFTLQSADLIDFELAKAPAQPQFERRNGECIAIRLGGKVDNVLYESQMWSVAIAEDTHKRWVAVFRLLKAQTEAGVHCLDPATGKSIYVRNFRSFSGAAGEQRSGLLMRQFPESVMLTFADETAMKDYQATHPRRA